MMSATVMADPGRREKSPTSEPRLVSSSPLGVHRNRKLESGSARRFCGRPSRALFSLDGTANSSLSPTGAGTMPLSSLDAPSPAARQLARPTPRSHDRGPGHREHRGLRETRRGHRGLRAHSAPCAARTRARRKSAQAQFQSALCPEQSCVNAIGSSVTGRAALSWRDRLRSPLSWCPLYSRCWPIPLRHQCL